MRGARRTLALLAACLLGGCAAGEAFAPTAVPAAGMPYAGLDENGYGPRSGAPAMRTRPATHAWPPSQRWRRAPPRA